MVFIEIQYAISCNTYIEELKLLNRQTILVTLEDVPEVYQVLLEEKTDI